MSIKIMNLVFGNQEITGVTKLVMLGLADNASDEGYCFPSMSTIAFRSSISVRSARRYITELESLRYISRVNRVRENGSQTSNGYHIDIGKLEFDCESAKKKQNASGVDCAVLAPENESTRVFTPGQPCPTPPDTVDLPPRTDMTAPPGQGCPTHNHNINGKEEPNILITIPQGGRKAPTHGGCQGVNSLSPEEKALHLKQDSSVAAENVGTEKSGNVPPKRVKREPSDAAIQMVERFVREGLGVVFPSAAERLTQKDKVKMALKVDDCHRIDRVSYERMEAIWRWAMKDDFWSLNMRSLAKFRTNTKEGEKYVHFFGDKMDAANKRLAQSGNPLPPEQRPKPTYTTNKLGEQVDCNGMLRDDPIIPGDWYKHLDKVMEDEAFQRHPDTQPDKVYGKTFRQVHRQIQESIKEILRSHR